MALGLLMTTSSFGSSQVAGLTSLDTLRDQARPLLIFAPKPDDPRLGIQVRTLQEHAAEARDRDLVGVALPYRSPSPTAAQFSPDEAEALRRRFHVAPSDFVVILVGKDGGSKLRSTKPLAIDKLNETIDSMPMRKDEMRGQR